MTDEQESLEDPTEDQNDGPSAPSESVPIGSEPEEDAGVAWSTAAQATSTTLTSGVEALATSLQRVTTTGTFRPFWDAARVLNQQVRSADPIALDDKLRLQARITSLCEEARVIQADHQARSQALSVELESALELVGETLADARTAADIQQVRADLTVIRERLDAAGATLGRAGRQTVWEHWQKVNQAAWQALSARWETSAQALVPILDLAQEDVEAGRPREARERIKQFRAAIASNEISRQSLRELSSRAESLWKQASALSQEKHRQYLEHTGRRVESWKGALQRQRRTRDALARDVEYTQRQAAGATTDVGAALLRGQATERERDLQKLDAEIRALEEKILHAEQALTRG